MIFRGRFGSYKTHGHDLKSYRLFSLRRLAVNIVDYIANLLGLRRANRVWQGDLCTRHRTAISDASCIRSIASPRTPVLSLLRDRLVLSSVQHIGQPDTRSCLDISRPWQAYCDGLTSPDSQRLSQSAYSALNAGYIHCQDQVFQGEYLLRSRDRTRLSIREAPRSQRKTPRRSPRKRTRKW